MRLIFSLLAMLIPLSLHAQEPLKLAPIKHIIIFYLENHSFDNLMGTFPGADGINNAAEKAIQTDAQGKPYEILPRVMDEKNPDPRFPDKLPNKPFLITDYVPVNDKIPDLVHRFYQLQAQIDGGKMDHFALISNAGGLVMGHYGEKNLPLWDYAKRYTLADHFFTGAFGGSMLNHFWLICACTPRYENDFINRVKAEAGGGPVPDKEMPAFSQLIEVVSTFTARLDNSGHMLRDGSLTPDGYAVNTIEPFNPPFKSKPIVFYKKRSVEQARAELIDDATRRLPPSTLPTIGDRLSEKNISWAWFSGGWKDAEAGHPDKSFVTHHQPFNYFAAYAPGTKARAEHLKDEDDFIAAIDSGTLPAVTFYKPIGKNDLHPGYSRLQESEDHVFALVRKIEQSSSWKDSLVIVTFDDTGGFWDHVPPPKGDRFGPGERIPTVIISPFAKKGFIDHTTYDTTSILKLIETKYDLKPLGERDAKANDLTNALE